MCEYFTKRKQVQINRSHLITAEKYATRSKNLNALKYLASMKCIYLHHETQPNPIDSVSYVIRVILFMENGSRTDPKYGQRHRIIYIPVIVD